MHKISQYDTFRLADTTGKARWFRFRTGDRQIGKRSTTSTTTTSGWTQESVYVQGEYRIVFGTGAIYSPTPTIQLKSVDGTQITYQGTHTTLLTVQ